jgi:hypothetical protein
VVRATTVLLAGAGMLAACGAPIPTARATPEAPSTTAVEGALFAVPVDLDHGGLLVTPPAAGATAGATVTEREADAMFDATDAVEGPHEFAILGLGLVTVAPRFEYPTPSTTTTPVPSTVPPTTTPLTTAPPLPTTTATTTTTTTTLPTTTTPGLGTRPPPALPGFQRRLAWVGIAWSSTEACPGSATTQPAEDGTTTYVAVVIDARTGQRVIAYRSGGSSPCTGTTQTPSVTEPNELLSVAWQPVGPASTAVEIQVPACGHYFGWTQVPSTGGGLADQVVVSVPFDPACGSTVGLSQAVDQVVPLGPGQALVAHAPVGPVEALQALPGG